MSDDELFRRLAGASPRAVPDPAAMLDRAFAAAERPLPRLDSRSLAAAAGIALALAASTPLWIEPSQGERERTETLVAAAAKTIERCARELNLGGNDDE